MAEIALNAAAPPRLRFGPFTLDRQRAELRRGTEVLPLRPKPFALLEALLARPGEVLPKDELLAAVWPGVVVSDDSLTQCVHELRGALGSEGAAFVRTVPRRGYRFDGAVEPVHAAPSATRRLSVIVLPFVEPGAPADQGYFADALTEDVTDELSRIRGSFVIAAPTALTYRHEAFDWTGSARELGVRYVLQGRLERSGTQVELSARLADAPTRAVLWSDRFVVAATDVRSLRRDVVARLVVALELELVQAEAERARAKPGAAAAPHPLAVDLVMQARAPVRRHGVARDAQDALALVERALALDPDDVEALVDAARLRVSLVMFFGPRSDAAALLTQAEVQVARALALDPFNALGQYTLSLLRREQQRLPEAVAAAERALEINPNLVPALSGRGELHVWEGEFERAIAPLERALLLSPRDPTRRLTLCRLGRTHLLLGDAAAALPPLEQAQALGPHAGVVVCLAPVLVSLGQVERARALYREWRGPLLAAMQGWHSGPHPRTVAAFREHLFGPLVAAGCEPDFAPFEPWLARRLQRP